MPDQTLILLASARQNSNTRKLVESAFKDVPHQVCDLLQFNISNYRYENDYPPQDSFLDVIEQVMKARVVVLATPVYWYAMSGLLKTFLDRWTELVTVQKNMGRRMKGKTIFVVAVGSDDALPDGFEVPFKLTAKYFDMHYGGSLYASTAEVETGQFHLGDHREFLRDLQEAQKESN